MSTKLGLIGDTHADIGFTKAALRSLTVDHDVDLVIQLGDFGWWPSKQNTFLEPVSEIVAELGTELWFLDGNHEHHHSLRHTATEAGWDGSSSERVQVMPGVHWLPRGHVWEMDGIRFIAVGGAFSVDAASRSLNVDWFQSEELLSYSEMHQAMNEPKCDVFFCHDVPDYDGAKPGNPSPLPEPLEDASLAHRKNLRLIANNVQPSLIVHGHWHHRYTTKKSGEPRIEGLSDNRAPENACVVLDLPTLEVSPVKGIVMPPPEPDDALWYLMPNGKFGTLNHPAVAEWQKV